MVVAATDVVVVAVVVDAISRDKNGIRSDAELPRFHFVVVRLFGSIVVETSTGEVTDGRWKAFCIVFNCGSRKRTRCDAFDQASNQHGGVKWNVTNAVHLT